MVFDQLLVDPSRLRLFFQPIVDFSTGAIVAAEALLRARVEGVDIAPTIVVASAIEHNRM